LIQKNFISYSKIFLNFWYFKTIYDDNQFVIANVKQLRTGGSFRILLPFFRTSWGVGVLDSAIFNSFHNRVEFGTILVGHRNFGVGVGLNTPTSPPPPLHPVFVKKLFLIPRNSYFYYQYL